MNIYSAAPEVEEIGRELIHYYHEHLVNTRVDFCFVAQVDEEGNTQPMMKKGKEHWGDARRISGLNAHLAGNANPFFCIEISQHAWERMEPLQRRALVDHELCHCFVEDDKLTLLPHDIEEFGSIVSRYGLWRNEVKDFEHIVQQLRLDLEVPPKVEHDDTTVTVNATGKSVTVTGKEFARVARNAGKVVNGRRHKMDNQPEAA